MIAIKKKSNIFLIFLIILAISSYAFFFSQNKGSIKIETTNAIINDNINNIEKGITTFKDVEYKISDINNQDYITRGKEATITKDEPDLIKLKKVYSFADLKDGSILKVKSEKANYYKNTKNIKYYQNVVITNKDIVIKADTANYYRNKNLIRLEKNVIIKDPQNTVKGDIAELDVITNNIKIFMIKKKDKVYGRREQIKN